MDIKVNPSEYDWKLVGLAGTNTSLLGVTDPTNGRTIINLVLPIAMLPLTAENKKFILNTYICGFMHGHKAGTTEKVSQIRNALGL